MNSKNTLKLANTFYNKASILKNATSHTILIPAGKPLYHGSIQPFADQIINDGFLRGNMWDRKNQKNKVSSGTMEEAGLIWFSDKKVFAENYARGQEAKGRKIQFSPGKVFVYRPSKTLKLTDRYAKISKEEAEKLEKINPRKYDPINEGLTAGNVAYKFIQSDNGKGLKEILNILGYDGIIYSNYQYGIVADQIKFDEYYDPLEKDSFESDEEYKEIDKEQQERIRISKIHQKQEEDNEKEKEKLMEISEYYPDIVSPDWIPEFKKLNNHQIYKIIKDRTNFNNEQMSALLYDYDFVDQNEFQEKIKLMELAKCYPGIVKPEWCSEFVQLDCEQIRKIIKNKANISNYILDMMIEECGLMSEEEFFQNYIKKDERNIDDLLKLMRII